MLIHSEAVWKYYGFQEARPCSLVSSHSHLLQTDHDFNKQYVQSPAPLCLLSRDGFWLAGKTPRLVGGVEKVTGFGFPAWLYSWYTHVTV